MRAVNVRARTSQHAASRCTELGLLSSFPGGSPRKAYTLHCSCQLIITERRTDKRAPAAAGAPTRTRHRDGAELALRGGSGGQAGLHFASHVGDDAEEALDEHQLAAVVHFVFLHGKNHFEAAFCGRGHARGHLHLFG